MKIHSLSFFAALASAQYPPTPEGLTTKRSQQHPEVFLSYKETHICETNAKAWSGYVHMPASYLSDVEDPSDPYNISTFFWYIEARVNPQEAPTTMYLAGGPGESSLVGATSDGGPCYVHADSNSTYLNEWSMNSKTNVLYVDQPVGSGYSYDELIKSTMDLTYLDVPSYTGVKPLADYHTTVPAQNTTFKYGTFPSQNPLHAPNTTGLAARTMWHFSQIWFADFPEWKTCDKRVSLWGNSYGGFWITALGADIVRENEKIQNGAMEGTVIQLDTIGSLNGLIDFLYQGEAYVTYAYNNTYDLPLITEKHYEEALNKWSKPKGCKALIEECRQIQADLDPNQYGINAKVNKACLEAEAVCSNLLSLNGPSGRSAFDIAHKDPDPFPPSYNSGFFQRAWVQGALGSPVNFTQDSLLIMNTMVYKTADICARAGMRDVEYLLDSGVKVSLVYGDRDYRCPWTGALNLAMSANWTGAEEFRAAGYEDVITNASYTGGVVKQYGNLSFTRVFESGHDTAAYQPETVYRIFNRVTENKDIATGKLPTSGEHNNYTSSGPLSIWGIKDELPPPPPVACYLYNIPSACSANQYAALLNGTAIIDEGFNVVWPVGTFDPVGGTGGGVHV